MGRPLASPVGPGLEPSPGHTQLKRLSGTTDGDPWLVTTASRSPEPGNTGKVKVRNIRGGDVLRDDEDVVVRGGDLDPAVLRRDAQRNYEVYGMYGISVFAVRGSRSMKWRSKPRSSALTA